VVTRNPIDAISGHRKNAMETISDIQLAPFLATGDARETISGDQKLTPFLATSGSHYVPCTLLNQERKQNNKKSEDASLHQHENTMKDMRSTRFTWYDVSIQYV